MRLSSPSPTYLCMCTKEAKPDPANTTLAGVIRLRCRREP
jgi:hypothetical protein